MLKLRMGGVCLGVALWLPAVGWAASLDAGQVVASWIPESASVQPGQPFRLGLRLEHEPHWHTYWKNPGDFGYATTVDWALPEGFEAGEFEYATPQWIPSQGLVTFGYEGTVTHWVTVQIPPDAVVGSTVRIGGEVSWLQCQESCIPGGGELFIELPVTSSPGARNHALAGVESDLPWTPSGWEARSREEGNTLVVTVSVPEPARQPAEGMIFFPEAEGLVDLAQEISIAGTGDGYEIRAQLNPSREGTPDVVRGLLVGADPWEGKPGRRAAAFSAPFGESANAALPADASPRAGVAYAIMAAFLGGILLNLMPCVFPVISLKILGFVNLAGEDPAKVWRHGLMFAAGVLVSFWMVAGILLAVKASVPSAGWGFQLKEPVVVISMCILFFLLALNLFGVFELGTSLTGVGGHAGSGLWGSFLSGVLATVVATPCTGPFMGVAVGVALTQPAYVSMAIFTFLGLGMATPYLLLSRFPQWLKVIPRPGPWMESLKQFLGFLLMAFALWLVWILNGLRGEAGLSRLLTGLLIVGFAAWVYGRWGGLGRAKRVRILATLVAVVSLGGGAVVSLSVPAESPWQPFSSDLVHQLRASGKPVFVDFTADWCLTCQANKKVALNTSQVQDAFREQGVALVEADWTRQDEHISKALAEYGRSGVPLYVLYGPDGGEPAILPQLLTQDIVLGALDAM